MARGFFFIINPAAGKRALDRWRHFEATLQPLGVTYDQALAVKPGQALELARQAAGEYDTIVAAGGDGTISEVVNGILARANGRPGLGIVPLGTGNDSARAVGIRHEADALRALHAGKPRATDLIEIHCQASGAPVVRYAFLFASIGITSDLLRHTTPRLKRLCGRRLAYIAGLLLALRRYSPGIMKVTCDTQTFEKRLIFACASNGETFGGGIRIAPGARLDDGKLNVNLIEAVGRYEAIRHILRLRQGRHTTHPKVTYKAALALAIETDPPVEVAADGDLIGETPARFRILPRALTVLTP